MNKNLFRLCALIILFNVFYYLYELRNLVYTIDLQNPTSILISLGSIVFVLLMICTGIGLWKMKKWALITLWIIIVFSFLSSIFRIFVLSSNNMISPNAGNVFSVMNLFSTNWISLIVGIVNSLFIYLVMAIFIALEFKQSKQEETIK